MLPGSRLLKLFRWLAAFALIGVASSAFAFGTSARFVLLTNQDSQFSVTGTWANTFPPPSSGVNPTFYGEFFRSANASGGAETATARWEFGVLAPSPGSYSFDVFWPDTFDFSGSAVVYRLESAPNSIFSGCGTYTTHTTFTGVNADIFEGRWLQVGTATLTTGTCYRLVLSNAGNSGAVLLANAARAERLFESSATITDMPRVATAFAPATTTITSNTPGVPTIITTLTVTCPQIGNVLVTGTGESAAVTNVAGTNFNGLAYSISKNSAATDDANIVQSSALATFNGDANRDFLNVGRLDSCAAGETITYRLTAYRAQAATGPTSFMYNGRLVGQFFATGF
jgi:hypothetical protein